MSVKLFLKKNAVLCAAALAAVLSALFVPPDAQYLSYFDYKTLTCLFCVLAVVCALRNINFFYILAQRIVRRFKNLRMCVLALVYITFIGSMLIANDMALLTFLPLGYYVLSTTGKREYMAFTFIMQNIAANLGGMLTPFGNPQNLYLYTKFEIPNLEFMSIMLPPFAVSVALITVCCLFVKREPLLLQGEMQKLPRLRTAAYGALFALAIAIVFRTVPFWIGLAVPDFRRQKGSAHGRLSAAADVRMLFCICGEHVSHKRGPRAALGADDGEHSARERDFMSDNKQCPVGDSPFAVHERVRSAAGRGEYRRSGDADSLACQPDNAV